MPRRGFLVAPILIGLSVAMPADSRSGDGRAPAKVELASPEVVVPLEMVFGRPVVEVRIGGAGPFQFVLDTGAGGTIIAAELADELKLPVTGTARIGDPINPGRLEQKQVRVESLALGGAVFSGVTATRMERFGQRGELGARGILGIPLFGEVLLTLDYGRKEVRLRRGALPDPDGKDVLACRTAQGGPLRVPVKVGSLELEAALDSGAPAGLSLPDRYMEQLPFAEGPVEVRRARTVNSEFAVHSAVLQGVVRIGAHTLENPTLRFNALPFANVGNEVLSRFTVTIDQKLQRIRFAAADSRS